MSSVVDQRNGGYVGILQGNVTESIILDASDSDLLVHVRVLQVHHRAEGSGGVNGQPARHVLHQQQHQHHHVAS